MASVLIVDDIPETVEPLAQFLMRSGHHVDLATRGREALMSVIDRRPDVVVLDIMMPEMDGLEVLEVLRSYSRLKSVPVIVLTGISDPDVLEQAKSVGAQAVLVKGRTPLKSLKRIIEELSKSGGADPLIDADA